MNSKHEQQTLVSKMNPQWSECLRNDGAQLEAGRIIGFSGPSAAPAATPKTPVGDGMLAALTDLGVLKVSGDDAATFLQAHFCNDVAAVSASDAQISGYCSPKGRLLSVFYLLQRNADLLLIMPRGLIESVHKRLAMFAQMARPVGKQIVSKVTRTAVSLSDASDELVVVGLALPAASDTDELVQPAGIELPLAPATALTKAGVSVVRLPTQQALYLCVAEAPRSCEIWTALKPNLQPVPAQVWELQEIRSGLPRIELVTQESFVPQMANLHLLQGVSFTKGCYPGQEIVARMQYLGTLKRRMERFRVNTANVKAGMSVVSGDDAGAGVVVRAAETGEPGQHELLAVMKISRLEAVDLRLESTDGAALELLDMPYATHEPEPAAQ